MSRFLLTLCALLGIFASARAEDMGTRAITYSLTGKDAASAVQQALVSNGGFADVRVRLLSTTDSETLATSSAPLAADAQDVTIDKEHHQWQAMLIITSAGKNLAPLHLDGRYEEMAQVPVLKRRMQNGDVIGKDDIEWSREPLSHIHKTTICDAKELIGKSPRRMISQDRPVRADEVASPTLITKGSQVTLLFTSPNLQITTLGEALENGAKGDVIRIRNVTSKSIIQGTVETGNRVRVNAPETTSAEAM